MSKKDMVRIDGERLNAVFAAYGTTPAKAAAKVGLGNAYFKNMAAKRGAISTTTVAALKSVGIDITPAIIAEQEEQPEQAEQPKQPENNTITVVLTLSPDTVRIIEEYSYDRAKDAERVIAAIKELAARWE